MSCFQLLLTQAIKVGRTWWALSRDNATPFAGFFSKVNERLSCPIPATVLTGVFTTAFGAIPLGNHTAFADLVGSFVILSSTSYALAIAPHVLTKRRNVTPGPFWMGNAGFVVNTIAVLSITLFNIMFCFPYTNPTTAETMNYNSVILVGVVALATIWWFLHASRNYNQPKVQLVILESAIRRMSKN